MNSTKYMQTDSRWGGLGYPKSPYFIRNCGCGECAIANIIIEIDKYKNYTPATIQPYCKQYADPKGNGTYWAGIPKMLAHYGLTEVKDHATMTPLWTELAKGNRVAVYLMGSRKGGNKGVKWTSSGHFVCSVGYKYENGKHWVYVKDSYSNSNLRNGWITYEDNMRNDVLKVWSAKLPAKAVDDGKLVVDGIGGIATVNRLQEFLGVPQTDGITIKKDLQKYVPALKAYDYGNGSPTVKAMQKWLGLSNPDGLWGANTSKGLQKKLGVTQDGIAGANTFKALQKYLNEHDKADYPSTTWVDNANAWARKIANEKYHYVVWNSKVDATKTCPICTGRKYDNYYGWNCIGFASAVWRHGGGLKSICNCHTISNEIGEQMYKAKTDADALAIAKKHLGLTSLAIIRNKNGIPKAQWKAGDLCLKFSGSTYKHMFYYMGNGQIADASRTNKVADNIKVRSYDNYSAKIIIRYIETKKTVEELAKEVIDGKWGSGSERKSRLEAEGYDYNAVQQKVNELISLQTSNADKIIAKAKEYAWAYGTASSKYSYSKGSAKTAYKNALKKYMGKTAKVSQSDCGYFVSTCVRASGVASKFLALAGLKEAFPSVPSTMKVVHSGKKVPDGLLQAGDIVRWKKANGHQHTVIIMPDGKIAEAGRSNWFPAIKKDTKKYNASNVKLSTLQVIRVK